MNRIMGFVFLLAMLGLPGTSFASNSFSCTVKDIFTSPSALKYVLVVMNCTSPNPIQSGTNGCTATTISDDSFTFDASDEHGKINLSLLLVAFAAGKAILATTYATCPTAIPSVPALYSLKIRGGG
jgi:hypothetical protein